MARATRPLYRPVGVALLRAAVVTAEDVPSWYPDPQNVQRCRAWLDGVWSSRLAEPISQASPSLAAQVEAILSGREVEDRAVRRATLATARYVLRAVGRPTPFGLFAGVAAVSFGPASVRWGNKHPVAVRADTQWLADVIAEVESRQEVVDRLQVMVNSMAVRRGRWLEAPHGQNRIRVRRTAAIAAVLDAAAQPTPLGRIAAQLTEQFRTTDDRAVRAMLSELLRQGVLVSELRAPLTATDPLSHVMERLNNISDHLPGELEDVHHDLRDLNAPASATTGPSCRAVVDRMRRLSTAGRSPLAYDLLLDADVAIPGSVGAELAFAAQALLKLSRHPKGHPVWRAYHAALCERYGTGSLVRLADLLNPDIGLGYPASYPGSVLPVPADVPTGRDERLLALAWQAANNGSREAFLTDEALQDVAGVGVDGWRIPPHVELAVRIRAASPDALQRGGFTLVVAPARAGGVLTSRFTATMTGSGLEEVYRDLPTSVEGALAAQLSFPPAYPHAENICRVPAYLPHLISLGEHRTTTQEVIPLADLAVTATPERLFLVSLSRRQVVEPQVFHALALDKQAPPLARFLAHLPRGFTATWTALDWGPLAEQLPYLPGIRYRRSILTPARWRLTTHDLPGDPTQCRAALQRWRDRWNCPATVNLREDERTLRLNLDEPLHAAILGAHLTRRGHAVLTDATTDNRWLNGHAHEIAVPLITTKAPQPQPRTGGAPVLEQADGQVPAAADSTWLYAKLYAHPERHEEIITDHLPGLSPARYWYIRYRSPDEPDHLRIRIRVNPGEYGAPAAAAGDWAARVRQAGLASRLVLDTYTPEIGRYGGTRTAVAAAETVFIADARAVTAALQHRATLGLDAIVLVALGMLDIAHALLGDRAMTWLAAQPAPASSTPVDRAAARQLPHLHTPAARGWPAPVEAAWQERTTALTEYRKSIPPAADITAIAESLLHMHHNRAVGINPDSEAASRRLTRQVALSWTARHA